MTMVERIGKFEDMAPGSARQVIIGPYRIAVVRIDEALYAIDDRCSHQDISLAEGEVLCHEKQLECWKHGSAFSLETGLPQSFPAIKPVSVYEVCVVDGEIEVRIP